MKTITSHQLRLVTWNTRDTIRVLYCRFVAHESVVSQPVTYDFRSQETRPAGSPLATPNSGHRRCDVLRVADLANGEAANHVTPSFKMAERIGRKWAGPFSLSENGFLVRFVICTSNYWLGQQSFTNLIMLCRTVIACKSHEVLKRDGVTLLC